MQNHNSLKKEFLKKWIRGLQICKTSKENMSLLQRKNAIKLSADLAIASTRKAKRHHWSNALINKAKKDGETSILTNKILQDCNIKSKCSFSSKNDQFTLKSKFIKHSFSSRKISKLKKYGAKKLSGAPNRNSKVKKARSIAKRLVKKRIEILKGLVPGGENLDEYSLVKETLDYVYYLRAQVEVMHYFANFPQLPIQILDS